MPAQTKSVPDDGEKALPESFTPQHSISPASVTPHDAVGPAPLG